MLENLHCKFSLRTFSYSLHLKKKTFLKVASSDSSRLKLLNDLQHLLYLLLIRLHVSSKRQIINNGIKTSAQIAVIIKASYKKRSHRILMFCKITVTELILKALGETFFNRKSIVLRPFLVTVVQV